MYDWRYPMTVEMQLSVGIAHVSDAVWPEKIAKCLKKLPKNYFTRKMIDLSPSQKLPKSVGDLGKLIVAKVFKNLPKVQ